jgi:hypothetical protein
MYLAMVSAAALSFDETDCCAIVTAGIKAAAILAKIAPRIAVIRTAFIKIPLNEDLFDPVEYRYCSAFPRFKLDPWPAAAKAEISKGA